MGLRALAESDLSFILEDEVGGFGWSITITDSEDTTESLIGFSDDISQAIDPDTGQLVSGSLVSVVLRISTLSELGFTMPKGIVDSSSKPWIVVFDDINGNSYTFKISESLPDRALGIVVCILEFYQS